jgi:L-idonate 5-dehydrogenase
MAVAAELRNERLIDTKPLISDVFSYRDSLKVFETASDGAKAMQAIVDFV